MVFIRLLNKRAESLAKLVPYAKDKGKAQSPKSDDKKSSAVERPVLNPPPARPKERKDNVQPLVNIVDLLKEKQIQNEKPLTPSQEEAAKDFSMGGEDPETMVFSLYDTVREAELKRNCLRNLLEDLTLKPELQEQLQDEELISSIVAGLKYLNKVQANYGQYLSVLSTVVSNRLNYVRQRRGKKPPSLLAGRKPGEVFEVDGLRFKVSDDGTKLEIVQ